MMPPPCAQFSAEKGFIKRLRYLVTDAQNPDTYLFSLSLLPPSMEDEPPRREAEVTGPTELGNGVTPYVLAIFSRLLTARAAHRHRLDG
jgi:hypothetical protein